MCDDDSHDVYTAEGISLTSCEASVDRLGAANPPPSLVQFDRTKRLPLRGETGAGVPPNTRFDIEPDVGVGLGNRLTPGSRPTMGPGTKNQGQPKGPNQEPRTRNQGTHPTPIAHPPPISPLPFGIWAKTMCRSIVNNLKTT